MNSVTSKPPAGAFWFSVIGIIGCFLLFALIVYMAYLPSRATAGRVPAGMTQEERLVNNLLTPEERKERLARLRETASSELHSYGWVDQESGVVRIPIEEAVDLTIAELQSEGEGN